jgi:DNA-binding GntR family transcriptional regulator
MEPLTETPPLRHRIHGQLQKLITNGDLLPGTRLVEGELAAKLGVSRGPIREALQLLQGDGYVDLRPRQGAFVHQPTRKEIEDFYDIRRALEAESARLAAERVTAEGTKRLKSVVKEGLDRLKRGHDPSSVAHLRMHREITLVADNPVLLQMLDTLEVRTTWYRSPFEPTLRQRAWEEHKAIVAAIVAGDSDGAMNAMSQHIARSRDYLTSVRGQAGTDDKG